MAFSESMFQSELAKYYDLMRQYRDYGKESRFADSLIQKNCPGAKSILDICCGTGEHAINMAKLGYGVTGIDSSPDMLAIAGEKAVKAGLPIDFRCIDTNEFDAVGEFQAAYCLGYTFLYMTTQEKAMNLLAVVSRALLPGGIFLVDFINGQWLLEDFQRDEYVYRQENVTIYQFEHSCLEENRKVKHIDFQYIIDEHEGPVNEIFAEEDLRIFFEDEVRLLLSESGFDKVESFGDYSLDADSPDVPDIVIVKGLKKGTL